MSSRNHASHFKYFEALELNISREKQWSVEDSELIFLQENPWIVLAFCIPHHHPGWACSKWCQCLPKSPNPYCHTALPPDSSFHQHVFHKGISKPGAYMQGHHKMPGTYCRSHHSQHPSTEVTYKCPTSLLLMWNDSEILWSGFQISSDFMLQWPTRISLLITNILLIVFPLIPSLSSFPWGYGRRTKCNIPTGIFLENHSQSTTPIHF